MVIRSGAAAMAWLAWHGWLLAVQYYSSSRQRHSTAANGFSSVSNMLLTKQRWGVQQTRGLDNSPCQSFRIIALESFKHYRSYCPLLPLEIATVGGTVSKKLELFEVVVGGTI